MKTSVVCVSHATGAGGNEVGRFVAERRPSASDGRSRTVVLTAAGHRVIDAAMDDHVVNEARLLAGLDPEERAALADLLTRCKAFIFPGFEDFGIAPIRAMAYGKPVIALAKGGALDTVLPNRTGTLFTEPFVNHLIEAVQKNSEVTFAPVEIRRHAEQFGVARFQRELFDLLTVN